jgi:multiple sugar transport system ATP-binding protein
MLRRASPSAVSARRRPQGGAYSLVTRGWTRKEPEMGSIALSAVTKEYVAGARAVDAVDLTIEAGEFFVLVGPSGCGKSTLLRLIAGLERPTAGSIEIAERNVTGLPPSDRDIAMVFQNYALYPHMTVRKNIGYGLKVRRMRRAEVDERVVEVARMLGIQELLDRRPDSLSGGQRQRVAMGRAIARRPSAYLMDEPLSNLDARLRVTMRAELDALHERLGVTTVYVTHDQVEAMTLGQRAAVMQGGVIRQVDTPQNLYNQPTNAFVAAFIGSPQMNFAEARRDGDAMEFAGFRIRPPAAALPDIPDGERVVLGIRPEDFVEPDHAAREWPRIEVDVAVREDLGHETLLFFPVAAAPLELAGIRDAYVEDEEEAVSATGDQRALFCCRIRSDFARGVGRVSLAIDPSALRYFDLGSGERVASQRPGLVGANRG